MANMNGERIYDLPRTCDGCSESTMVRLSVPDDGNSPYVCKGCDDAFDRAVDAAAVVLANELGHTLAAMDPPVPAPNTRRMARRCIEAFIDADWAESKGRA